jgi:ferredoxin
VGSSQKSLHLGIKSSKYAAVTFVVLDVCIMCKHTDCVEVCPVDCFYEGENMLVINPDECIDCGVCEPECPIEAIVPDSDKRADKFLELNRIYSEKWPVITKIKPALSTAEKYKDKKNKLEEDFSERPGDGD